MSEVFTGQAFLWRRGGALMERTDETSAAPKARYIQAPWVFAGLLSDVTAGVECARATITALSTGDDTVMPAAQAASAARVSAAISNERRRAVWSKMELVIISSSAPVRSANAARPVRTACGEPTTAVDST